MKRDKLIKNYIKEERGAAMIVVLCVMAIVLALCLSILLAVYQMFASVNDEARDDVYYHQALSASIALQNRLEKESQAMPTSISSIEDYIFYFMANNDTYPTPYEVTFEQEGKSGDDAYGDMTIKLEKEDNASGAWGDDYNCYCFITLNVQEPDGDKVATVTTKYQVTCEDSTYVYLAKISDGTYSYDNISYIYNEGTDTLNYSYGWDEIPAGLKKIPLSYVVGKTGILENYKTDATSGKSYSLNFTRSRDDKTEFKFRFLERL